MSDAPAQVPSLRWLGRVLLTRFNLVYRRGIDTSCYKYQDPRFHERRLWVSRLLAYFFLKEPDLLIVSIDESSFRSDKLPKAAWQQELNLSKRRRNAKESANPELRTLARTKMKRIY